MLKFPHLSFIDKMRMGLVVLYLRFTKNWQALEKYTAHDWLCKYMGETRLRHDVGAAARSASSATSTRTSTWPGSGRASTSAARRSATSAAASRPSSTR